MAEHEGGVCFDDCGFTFKLAAQEVLGKAEDWPEELARLCLEEQD